MIGQEFGHGEDKNTAAQLAAHAILGATLAYINGGDPTAGGSAVVASEAAATYFTNQYKDNKDYQDANGEFQPNLLPESVKTQIRDLTAGIGAVIGGAAGDSTYNAQLAGVIGQNAVENNQYAQFYVCNEKNQCVLVDDKPVQPFTFFEENFIRPISVLFGVVGKVNNAVNIGKKKVTADTQTARTSSKPVFNTDKEAEAAAKAMGYVKVNERSQNAAVFKKGNSYITRDRTGHGHGGAWKEANSVKALSSKETRNATLDINMKKVKD